MMTSLLLAALVCSLITRCCSSQQILDYPGDIKLGALFPIHKQGTVDKPCSEIQKEDGIQPLEALLFTLDEINNDKTLLPGIRLGAKVLDSCDHPIHASEQSMHVIRGFIARKANLSCDKECDDNIVGLIGPQTSEVSVQIANLGRLFRIPQVSYLSTSVTFCNREKYPYFFRTVPSDIHQAQAIVKLLDSFNWNYASIVYSNSEYGETGYEAIKRAVANESKVCLTEPHVIHNQHFNADDYERLASDLLSRQDDVKPYVVIVFADRAPSGNLLEAAKRLNIKQKIIWVGSDAWASRESVVHSREEFVEGAIAVQPLMRELPGFREYYKNIFGSDNKRNPWFDEYLKAYHNCTEQSECNLNIFHDEKFKSSQHFVRDAVYAFAHALHSLHKDSCADNDVLCDEFRKRMYTDLVQYLSKVEFPDVDGNKFLFYNKNPNANPHDGPPRYSILNFERDSTGSFDWHNVGTYYKEDIVDLDSDFLARYSNFRGHFDCQRKKCMPGEIKVPDTEDKCCWHCSPCNELDYKLSEYECRPCEDGHTSTPNRSHCVIIEPSFLNYMVPWATGAIAVASLGIVITFLCTAAIIAYWNTTVIRTSGRELSLILLSGTFLSFLSTFVIVSKPSNEVCMTTRFAVGFCYTVCYAAVVTKMNRLSRIFNAGARPRFTSPMSSTMIAVVLILVEIVINTLWLIVEPPTTELLVSKGKRILVCGGVGVSIVTGLAYPFFLIVCATLYAFKTRKLPNTYNETKFIFFTNIVTTIHWFAYVPLYLASTNHEIRGVILAFSLSVSGFVQLCCFFFPKVYAVVFKPEKRQEKPRTSRVRKFETPPHSVAVGFADGALLGDVSRYNNNIFSLSAAAISADFGIPLDPLPPDESLQRRHPTWSHTLFAMDRPRSRSLSVTRSTQTGKERNHEPRIIAFNAEMVNDDHNPLGESDVHSPTGSFKFIDEQNDNNDDD